MHANVLWKKERTLPVTKKSQFKARKKTQESIKETRILYKAPRRKPPEFADQQRCVADRTKDYPGAQR